MLYEVITDLVLVILLVLLDADHLRRAGFPCAGVFRVGKGAGPRSLLIA